MSVQEQCSNCRYYNESANNDSATGACRRYPPMGSEGLFPLMESDEWCGEWLPKPIVIKPQYRPLGKHEVHAESFGENKDVWADGQKYHVTEIPGIITSEPPRMTYRQWLLGQALAGGADYSRCTFLEECIDVLATKLEINK